MSNLVSLQHCDVRLSDSTTLKDLQLEINEGQHWLIVGANGSGKSALAAVLNGDGSCLHGSEPKLPRVELVSFETQKALIEAERKLDDSDITDVPFAGTSVATLLAAGDQDLARELLGVLNMSGKLDRGFRQLSTGETRKLLLIRAISNRPQLLVLDEPFEGLDADSCVALSQVLERIQAETTIVLVLNRLAEIPAWLTHVCITADLRVQHAGPIERDSVQQLLQLHDADVTVPRPAKNDRVPVLAAGPLIRITNGRVAYGDETIFSNLTWQVDRGEHWQVVGPNGSGKTCLLNLISGDHPQCYVNDIFVVGFKRGNGESIWDIKQHIGYVSSSLQLEYRVSISPLNVLLSGFFDSIGVYEKASDDQILVAKKWLEVLGLLAKQNEPFNQCSYGEQRMLLIARAMVKHPQLLILDEPCLGLDELNRQLVLALIEKICGSDETTVLYVNHHTEDQISTISRVLNMADYR